MTTLARRRLIGFAIAAFVAAVDQFVKWHMVHVVRLRDVKLVDLLPVFDLRWVENYGVSMGLFTAESMEMRWLLVALTAAIALVVFVWMLREQAMAEIGALALVLGGAIGNIYDRATIGYVIDYADLHFGEFRPFFVFNIADAAISIGVLIILARSLLSREKPPEAKAEAAAETAPES